MRSKISLLLIMLLIVVGAGNAFAQATFTATPSQVPKGAYVNGYDGNTDDNYFYQVLYYQFNAPQGQDDITITLPTGMTVADVDSTIGIRNEISLTWDDASDGGMTFAVSAATTITSPGTIVITVGGANAANTDDLWVMFPVETLEDPGVASDDYTIAFAGSPSNDDITDGNGPVVTYRNAGALQLVAMETNMSGDDDSTATDGEKYPSTVAQLFGALPDLVEDGPEGAVEGTTLTGALDQTDLNEVTYTLWTSTDSTLSRVSESFASHAIDFDNTGNYTLNEGGNGGTARISTVGLPEGEYYVYITSDFTGDFPLARSGKLTVLHYPIVKMVGWDYDGSSDFDNTGMHTDDFDLTVDTGNYYRYDGNLTGTDTRNSADIYVNVDDYDDNAQLIIYYSTNSALTTSDLITSGTVENEDVVVDSLANAIELADTLYENQEVNNFVKWTWDLLPSNGSYVTAGTYYIYAVANDGKNQSILVSKGSNASDSETINLMHSPHLAIDAITEYNLGTDSDGDADVTIHPGESDVIMLSWGKSGVSGDKDIDDSCLISFYIDLDTSADNTADYGSDQAATLISDAASSLNGAHQIVTGLEEDPESKELSYYAWNLKDDTTFTPVDEAGGIKCYHLYAVIDENKTGGTKRVVALGDGGLLTSGETLTTIEFDNDVPFARLYDPPAEGVTISGDETYRFRFDAFDLDTNATVGVFLVSAAYTEGVAVSSIDGLIHCTTVVQGGTAYCLTDDDGYHGGGTQAWISENTGTYYDMTIRLPSEGTLRYTTDMGNNAIALTAGTYWVYVGIEDDADDFGTGTEVLYRAPGPITLQNISDSDDPAQRNAMMTPSTFSPSEGDTTTISLRAADEGMTVDIMDYYIALEKEYFDVVSVSAPFTDSVPSTGILIANEAIDDTTNGRWILHATAYDDGNPISEPNDTDLGSVMATFRVVSNGTLNALKASTAIYFVNEPSNGWITKFSNDGVNIPIDVYNNNIEVLPRGIAEGIVEFEGRINSDYIVTFELRERGSYVSTPDASLISRNDGKVKADSTITLADTLYSDPGIQYKLDSDGKFTLYQIPSGEWDLVVAYNRYLSKLSQISVYPGLDTLYVNFGQLLGGDCVGYTDSSGAAWPDNYLDSSDLTRIKDAYLDTADSTRWDDGVYNYKWADIDESGKVGINDLTMATANLSGGAQGGAYPWYKPAVERDMNNLNALVDFMNVPAELTAGDTYTIQVVLRNAGDVRGYFVDMKYNTNALAFEGIVEGDFLDASTYSFPTIGNETVGLSSAAYGHQTFAGDGILAEVKFRALTDGMLSPDMLGIREAVVVNSNYLNDHIVFEAPSSVENDIPVAFELNQNFPNPFNPTTAINFAIPENSNVDLKIYDILGRHVRTLASGNYQAGNYSVIWDATDMSGHKVSAGVYFYRIEAGNHRSTKRMLLLK